MRFTRVSAREVAIVFRFAFAIYVVVEVLAIAAVGSAIGAGWTLLALIAGSGLGMVLFAAQARKVIEGISQVSRGQRTASGVVADSTLGAAGVGLLLIPGLVTSVLGILALLPPTRWLLRPFVLAIARRRSVMVATLVGERGTAGPLDSGLDAYVRRQAAGSPGSVGHVVVDGEVVDLDGKAGPRPNSSHHDADQINPLRPGLPPRSDQSPPRK